MTDHDLATCREWCKANGVNLMHSTSDPGYLCFDRTPGYLGMIGHHRTEQEIYEVLAERLAPIIQSVRNFDAVEVPGPYFVESFDDSDWRIGSESHECTANLREQRLSEQTARHIAGILNRECGDGK